MPFTPFLFKLQAEVAEVFGLLAAVTELRPPEPLLLEHEAALRGPGGGPVGELAPGRGLGHDLAPEAAAGEHGLQRPRVQEAADGLHDICCPQGFMHRISSAPFVQKDCCSFSNQYIYVR